MRVVLSIMRREFQSQFVSPIAYAVIVVFLVISGYGFVNELGRYLLRGFNAMVELSLQEDLVVRTVVWIRMLMLLSLPALSMRLFTEERKAGTIELLLTSPLTTPQLVLGKFLGVVSVFALILAFTTPYVGLMAWKGNPDWGPVLLTYLGLFLYGSVILAAGVFASSLTENQIVAFLLALAFFLPFVLADFLIQWIVPLAGPAAGDVVAAFSVNLGLSRLALGILDTHYLVLFVSLIFLYLFLGAQVLDSARWR